MGARYVTPVSHRWRATESGVSEMRAEASKSRWLSRGELTVLAVTLAYTFVWLIASVRLGNSEFLFYVGVMAVLIAIVSALHLRVRFHLAALWGLSLWGLLHMAGGLMPIPESWPRAGASRVLYNLWLIPGGLKYDQAVHAFGFGLVTWICWQALQQAFAMHRVNVSPSLGLLTLCAAAGMGLGAVNEVVEFAATLLLPGTNVGGYLNTGWDLVANLVGCVMAAVGIRVGWRPNRPALRAEGQAR
jgi:hypothetical protein